MVETDIELNNHTNIDCKCNKCYEEKDVWNMRPYDRGYNIDEKVWEGPLCPALVKFFALMVKETKELCIRFIPEPNTVHRRVLFDMHILKNLNEVPILGNQVILHKVQTSSIFP